MKTRREVWREHHGPIPKGWLIHSLNGDKWDICLDNLAAVPRYPTNQWELTAPYVARIIKLERELKLSKGEK